MIIVWSLLFCPVFAAMTSLPDLPEPLSAKDVNSFAYPTMKDRLPVIVSKIADYLSRNRDTLTQKFGGEGINEELKSVIGAMSQLRHEVMTNKPATPIRDDLPDAEAWNNQLKKKTDEAGGEPPKWFESAWLWMECYLYRKIQEAPNLTTHLKSLDVFADQKQSSFKDSYSAMSTLTMYLFEFLNKIEEGEVTSSDVDQYFLEFLQISLWGNKCDLSISAGSSNFQKHDPVEQLKKLEPKILVDNTNATLQVLRKAQEKRGGKAGPVVIVLDNAGFELVTDLCLAEFLIVSGLASSVHFHAKAMPWFVSDVTEKDFHWTLKSMSAMNHLAISRLYQSWNRRLKEGTWKLLSHPFWTLPHAYSEMKSVSPDLYSELAKYDLILFKGDLNYRKLVGDLNWDTTVEFSYSLQGFHPAPLCALRALKADVVVGLKPGQAEKITAENADWMVTGEYAVISLDS